jgi:hypothetical protein
VIGAKGGSKMLGVQFLVDEHGMKTAKEAIASIRDWQTITCRISK